MPDTFKLVTVIVLRRHPGKFGQFDVHIGGELVASPDRGVLPQTVAFRPGHELGSLVESRLSVEVGQGANFAGVNRPVAQDTAIPAPNAEAIGLDGSERSDALPRAAGVA